MKGAAGNGAEHRRGLWTVEEDRILTDHVKVHGKGKWNRIPKLTGLKRCGKSCRLRWMNYLSPGVKRGVFSEEEDDLIIRLHKLLGNRWSLIAGRVPGRTDNQVKNHWNTHLSKKLGVKQRKCKINASSSKSSKESGANSRTELKSNDDGSISCRKDEAEIHNVMEDSSEKVRETTSLQDPVLIGDCYDNFWDPYLCAPNLMEFLDQSLDLFWDGM
uniref:Uncharacterized protein n=1 Tax=Salix viminalis TaxID=40686 RepID=A0A6N2N372_SALVM